MKTPTYAQILVFLLATGLFSSASSLRAQQTFNVSDAASLTTAINQAFQDSLNNPSITDTINIAGNISATSQMIIDANVIINGNGYSLNMNNADRAFFVAGGTVSINNLTIQNGNATGGTGQEGGGAGAGLGGAIFVGSGTYLGGVDPTTGVAPVAATGISAPNVTLNGVSFVSNQAVGGLAATEPNAALSANGGGGGMGGSGGLDYSSGNVYNAGGGGGGFGNGAVGGNSVGITGSAGSNGAFINVIGNTAAGNGGSGSDTGGGQGGSNGGGGGGGAQGVVTGTGAGGGVGGGRGYYGNATYPNGGGNGGFGGGGGGGRYYGANGGFGGGGGNGTLVGQAGTGGFGGGGGGGGNGQGGGVSVSGGFGGGDGVITLNSNFQGGGGLGAGGALFVMAGASVTIEGGDFTSNSVTAGTGSTSGSAYGADLFLGADVTFNVTNNLTVNSLGGAGNTSDPNVSNHASDPNAQGGIIKSGAGTLTLTASNYYTGATAIHQGTVALGDGALEQGTSQVLVGQNSGDSGTLALGSSSWLNASSGTNPGVVLGLQAGSTGAMTIGSGAGSSGAFLGVNQISGGSGGGQLIFNQNYAAASVSNTVYNFLTALTGNLQVVQNGPGTTLLMPSSAYGANTFTGGIVVNNGMLQLGTNTALPSGSDLTVNGGTFDFNGYTSTGIGALTLNGGVITNSSGSGSVVASSLTSISGIIAASLSGNVSLVQEGGGTTTLTTNATYGGNTIIHAGTLAVGNNASINGTASVYVGYNSGDHGTLILGSGSTLGLAGFSTQSDFPPVALGYANGSSGTIQIGTGAGSRGAYVEARYFQGGLGGGSVVFDQSLDAQGTNSIYPFFTTLQGNLSVIQNGSGTTQINPLYGSNSYTGSTIVNGGTLLASAGGALGYSTNITVNTGGALDLGASNAVSGNQQFTLNGGKVVLSADQTQNFGNWNILGTSLVDLGGTTSTFTFSAFSINGTLAIWNWNAATDSIFITGASDAFYSEITFYSDNGLSEIGTGAIVNQQLQAVPEPSTYLLFGLGALATVIAARRRGSRFLPRCSPDT